MMAEMGLTGNTVSGDQNISKCKSVDIGTIKNDLTNYRQYVDSSQISDVESDDILLLKLKGIAIECIF